MKAGLFLVVHVILLPLAATQPQQPFWRRISHRHHAKRQESSCPTDGDIVTSTATAIDSVTYQYEDVVVYVDDSNKPISTTTIYRNILASTQTRAPSSIPATSPAPAPAASPSQSPPPPPPISSSAAPAPAPAPAPASAPAANEAEEKLAEHRKPSQVSSVPPPPASSSSAAAPVNSGGSGGSASSGPGFGSAISYTPYNCDNSCKSAQQVATDLQQITGYQVIRLYGTDCNQVANVIAATKGKVTLFLGIFDINSIQNEVQTISSAVKGNWGIVNTVNVGNELVNGGGATAAQVTAAIGTARSALKAVGYSGPVVTVDTMVAMKANPELCTASDFCAINCHAFFDGNTLPSGAGAFVKGWAQQVSDAAGGKTVVITESGWPTLGGSNKLAAPSQENHDTAIASLKSSFGGGTNLILYGMYNDCWKKDGPTTHGAEKFWGIHGNAPSA